MMKVLVVGFTFLGLAMGYGQAADLPDQFRDDIPQPDGSVSAMVLAHNRVYVAGKFAHLPAQFSGSMIQTPRSYIAALDATTGRPTNWKPEITGGEVNGLAVRGDTIFISGTFTNVNGQPRTLIAAVDAHSGRLQPWDARLSGGFITDMIVSDDLIYLHGSIRSSAEPAAKPIVVLSVATGEMMSATPRVGQQNFIRGMAASDGHVYFGSVTEQVWDYNQTTGEVTTFVPLDVTQWIVDHGLRTQFLHTHDRRLYGALEATSNLNGDFAILYCYDLEQKKPLWSIKAGSSTHHTVHSLHVDQQTLFVAGFITASDRINYFALNANTGAPVPWGFRGLPDNQHGPAMAIVATNHTIYVGGISMMYDWNRIETRNLLAFSRPGFSALSVDSNTNGAARVLVSGNAGEQHHLQSSTNVVSWHTIATNLGAFIYEPVNPDRSSQFFRVLTP